jgi:hypothetical protein
MNKMYMNFNANFWPFKVRRRRPGRVPNDYYFVKIR